MNRGTSLSLSSVCMKSAAMKRLSTRRQWSRVSGVVLLMLWGLIIGGCANNKTAILGRWEQTGCDNKSGRFLGMTASGWAEIEFLKGDTVILKNNGSWTYSFPQAGFLNIGGNMGVTYQYETKGDLLTLREDEDYCVFRRVGSAASSGGGSNVLLWVLLILLAVGSAVVYLFVRRGSQQRAAPPGTASPAPPTPQAFCMHCGQPVQAGSRFCLHCGKPLS